MTLHVMLKGTKSQGAYWNIVSDQAEGKKHAHQRQDREVLQAPET